MNVTRTICAYLLVLPGLLPILALIGLVVAMVISQSLGYLNLGGDSGFSLRYWQTITADHQFWRALFYSTKIAVLTALSCATLAYPITLWLRRPFPGSTLISALLKAPILVHSLVAAFLFVNFISYQGFVNLALVHLNFVTRPVRMQNDDFGFGVLILQIWKDTPVAFLILIGAVKAIGDDILDAARDLGAGFWSRLYTIIVPLSLRALQSVLILVFIWAVGDFSLQAIAGPTTVNSMSQYMMRMQATGGPDGWNLAAVVGVILMISSLTGALILTGLITMIIRRVGK